jgi:2-amino-4-hydroxy-6-hydroxymethyldihydropteridine diphosphokinase
VVKTTSLAGVKAVVGLGSNLGDRRAVLARAAAEVERLGTAAERSSLYETQPVGPPQPLFLNGALALETELGPLSLLDALLDIERRLGRIRAERWGPRLIDLDILWTDSGTFASARLTVPHPELRRRAFALRPLLDVAPAARDPSDDQPYSEVLAGLDGDSPIEIAGTRYSWA